MTEPCRIIGVLDNGPAGLTPEAMRRIVETDLVIGASRTLALFSEALGDKTERHDLTGNLAQVPQWIADARDAQRQVVVLATGDPLCHGIAAYLIGKLGREAFEVIPNVSTLQWAFARLGLAWHDARIASVHSRDAGEWTPGAGPEHGLYGVLQQLRQALLLAVFTSPENSPDRIARMLQAEFLADEYEMAVAECLLQRAERVSHWLSIADAAEQRFADPNLVILRKLAVGARASRPLFGIPDESFKQRAPDKGLITKREVRAVSLARLGLCPDSIVWDIGAGSGAVGLEAARLCPQGHVYAIEKNEADFAIAWSNRSHLRVTNYSLVHDRAPAGLDDWPDPDAVLIGGSGGELRELIELCLEKLRPGGNLVMNFATLENLSTAVETLKACGADWDVVQLQASRSRPILDMHRMQAENPIWIVCARRTASVPLVRNRSEQDARGPTGARTSCPPHKFWHSRGYLPHCDTPGLLQSVTFRLADALPTQALEGLLRESEDDVERYQRIEALLDAGHGACWLKQPEIADIVEDALLHGDGDRYRLLAWCVMPNHVHVLIETRDGWPLPGVLHSWKSFTAKAINRHLGRTGTVWMADYFDRYIRDDHHLAAVTAYIHGNPVKAGLVTEEGRWPHSSASLTAQNCGQDVRGSIGARTSCPQNTQP